MTKQPKPSVATTPPLASEREAQLAALRRRARQRGVNRLLYRLARAILVPFFRIYFRLESVGDEHLPRTGPLLLAANHRSFLDPFIIGAIARRPIYYVAKRELFEHPLQAWLLSSLGAFPIDRGAGDIDAIDTAGEILSRGDCVVIFPEGTRVRPGPLGSPRTGVGRLALQSGVQVVPVAVFGTEHVRKGVWIRPRKVRVRCGLPLRFPTIERPSRTLASAATGRIWTCINLQWEWLGGAKAPRPRAAQAHDRERVRAA